MSPTAQKGQSQKTQKSLEQDPSKNAEAKVGNGRQTFRFDTFGDQTFWGDTLKLHQAIEGAANGGVGTGVSPRTALAVGLKVDVDALPSKVLNQIEQGRVNLDDPRVTLALLKLNAVVGITGVFSSSGTLQSTGIQCALCHSRVDNSIPSLCAGAIYAESRHGCHLVLGAVYCPVRKVGGNDVCCVIGGGMFCRPLPAPRDP